MSDRQGGRQGDAQGGRENSLTDSLAKLPGLSRPNDVQGGKPEARGRTRKPAESRDADTPGPPPSLPADVNSGVEVPSQRVAAGHWDEVLIVHQPAQLPELSVGGSRALLAMLVELTAVGILDGPSEGVHDGC